MVDRVVGQNLGPEHPHLVDLAGELDEVAVGVRARELRVGHAGEQPVQRVAELVEERVDLVVGEQGRLARGRLGHVEVVGDDHGVVEQGRLRDEGVHPRAAALRVAGVEVERVEAHRGAVVVAHLEHPHVGVVGHDVGALGEGDAIELRRCEEHPVLQHPLGLEVRTHRDLVDVVLGLSHLLGEVRPVVGLNGVPGLGLEIGLFLAGVLGGGSSETGEHRGDVAGVLGGLVGDDPGGVRVEPEELGALRSQAGDLEHDLGVVPVASAASPGAGGGE